MVEITKENVAEIENLIKTTGKKFTKEIDGVLYIDDLDWTDDDIDGDIKMLKDMGCSAKYEYRDDYHGTMNITTKTPAGKHNIAHWLRNNYWGPEDFDDYFCDLYPHLKKYI